MTEKKKEWNELYILFFHFIRKRCIFSRHCCLFSLNILLIIFHYFLLLSVLMRGACEAKTGSYLPHGYKKKM